MIEEIKEISVDLIDEPQDQQRIGWDEEKLQDLAQSIRAQLVIVIGGHKDRLTPSHDNCHLVIEIVRQRQDDFVTGIGNGENGVHERHIAAGSDEQSVRGANLDSILARELSGDRV